ncbi:hypothetical protein SLG_17550 [Sphingobium sp. SYK-6]|uniref:CtrA inhibitor SciP n=1 Tax=Sphingobium sp. (strain NBRC 103272 / SYK-6) TaxID=627192 RepID=UPI0002277218|nr:DUF1153 domain-containing protein [Sphingobium sp. SYK-6]BAK66430.1 hypothetical protein SLG_17550 [Sphingobium sp. SYK-6]
MNVVPFERNQPVTSADRVIGPLGELIGREDLPAPDSQWTPRRKAEVVAAVNGGLMTADEVMSLYNLSVEEFASWQRAVERFGLAGLRQTRIQHYRDLQERSQRFGWAA